MSTPAPNWRQVVPGAIANHTAPSPLLDDGYEARFVRLRAYFPGRSEPVDFDLSKTLVSADADLATLKFEPFEGMPPPVPLAPKGSVVAGQRVLLLAANPGRVKEIVPVTLPEDRTLDIRETAEFVQLSAHLRRVLETC